MKAGAKRVTDIEELDRQMAVVEGAAGVKARYEERQGHVKARKGVVSRLLLFFVLFRVVFSKVCQASCWWSG